MSVDRTQEKFEVLFETFTWSDKESQALLFEEINKDNKKGVFCSVF